MKNRVVTYEPPGEEPALDFTGILHEPNCRYLKPSKGRPYTGSRKAMRKELKNGEPCKVC